MKPVSGILAYPTLSLVNSRDKDLRAILGDGIAFSVMVGLGETHIAAFALAIGHGEATAGLVASVPLLAGALMQLVTPRAVRRLGSYRRWVVLAARAQAACFVPLIAGALVASLPLVWLFSVASCYWASSMAAGAAWNPWVARLVPAPIRARFFARRTHFSQAAVALSVLLGGTVLERFAQAHHALWGFALLFTLAMLARVCSASFLARQSDPLPDEWRASDDAAAGAQIGAGRSRTRLFAYLIAAQLAVHVAAPFFTPYMLVRLRLRYDEFVLLTAAAFAARIFAVPLWGRLAQRYGAHRLLWIAAIGIVPLPSLWIVSSSLVYLFGLQLVAGAVWGAFELANLLLFIEAADERERTALLTRYNLANAIAIVAGSALGAVLLAGIGPGPRAYAILFIVSALGRLAALPLLRGTPDFVPVSASLPVETLAVRPSIGAIERPDLSAVPPAARTRSDLP